MRRLPLLACLWWLWLGPRTALAQSVELCPPRADRPIRRVEPVSPLATSAQAGANVRLPCEGDKYKPRPILDAVCDVAGKPFEAASNGSGALFDLACTTSYVLPPLAGNVRVAELTASANVALCPDVLGFHRQLDASLARLDDLSARLDDYLASFDALQAEALNQGAALDALAAAQRAADAALVAAANTSAQDAATLANAQADYEECVLLRSEAQCTAQRSAAQTAQTTLDAFLAGTYQPAQTASDEAQQRYQEGAQALTEALDALSAALDPIVELNAQLDAVRAEVLAVYQSYAGVEGATGTLTYDVGWDRLLIDYQKANMGAGFTYEPIKIQSATLMATALIGGEATTVPALLWSTLPDGSSGLQVLQRGGSVRARIGLSLVGACPYYPAGSRRDDAMALDGRELAAYVTVNVAYIYQVYVRASSNELGDSDLVRNARSLSSPSDAVGASALASAVRSEAALRAAVNVAHGATDEHIGLQQQVDALRTESQSKGTAPEPRRPDSCTPIAPPAHRQAYQVVQQSGALTFVP